MTKYDAAPYAARRRQPYPFVDIGNQYLVIGAQYLPSTLAKLTWAQVAPTSGTPASPVAKGVDGTANSHHRGDLQDHRGTRRRRSATQPAAKAGAGSL